MCGDVGPWWYCGDGVNWFVVVFSRGLMRFLLHALQRSLLLVRRIDPLSFISGPWFRSQSNAIVVEHPDRSFQALSSNSEAFSEYTVSRAFEH